ncbi:hypothetical protein A2917_01520 [Candidatus Nomurabacteria bacterium RIFCSPLOWO2_01_FULL_42_17]|uniref:Uncharacterized protein n=1 Tax=Candidatus Nomurabacteria bacterium RIFCSPLOWO2_01_FULL_42_17 TaxID=1801780 RepID=A0A1F6XLU3_9BACT|nr:MAG: hypothetical protein A2917_01520 [Candidatus Nomurabacteria bacterium RIFCSPLOWO2_01_FULL_42_17]
MSKFYKIEKEILEIKEEIFDLPNKLRKPIPQSILDGQFDQAKKPLVHRLEILEHKRNFLIDKRESWLPKTIWNLLIPIIISIIVSWFVVKLNLNNY